MMKSHVSAPRVYLKYFTIQSGIHRSNTDGLNVYDLLKKTIHHKCSPRGDWIKTLNFFSAEIEAFNNQFENKYPRVYKRFFEHDHSHDEDTIQKMTFFLTNLFARSTVATKLPESLRSNAKIKDNLVPRYTFQLADTYHNLLVHYIHEGEPNLITSDNPLISHTLPKEDSTIHFLPLDFRCFVMLTCSPKKELSVKCYEQMVYMNPLKIHEMIVREEIEQAKRFIIFHHDEELLSFLPDSKRNK